MFRNFKIISYVVFGRGCFNQLGSILAQKRKDSDSFMVFLVDDVFESNSLIERIPLGSRDYIISVNVDVKQFMLINLQTRQETFQIVCLMELLA